MASVSFKRTAAFVAAFGIALAPAAAGLNLAYAEEGGGEEASQAPAPAYNSIDWTKDGDASLTIIKKKLGDDETPGDPATGEPIEGTPGTELEGVTFEIKKVTNVNLRTNAGWAAGSKLATGAADAITPEFGPVLTQTTDANGQSVFSGLELGLYLVTETDVPEGVVPSAPFYVFIPMTSYASDQTAATTWNYDPTVYPKNTESAAEKAVEDADQNVSDKITYTITSDIPTLAGPTTNISKYIITDDLDEEQLTTSAAQISVGLSDGTTFEQGVDYNVTVNAVTQEVEITFTNDGLVKLTQVKRDDAAVRVVTKIEADVSAIGDTDGVVVNDATIIYNNGGGSGDTTTPTDEVTTKWGKVKVNKKNEANDALAGATFELYRCSEGGALDGEKITINGQDSWVTEADGTFIIDGLHVTNLEDNDVVINKFYCLVETKAPAGYAKLVEPIVFQLHPGAPGNTDVDGTHIVYTADVVNVTDETLPGTGGMGVGLIIAAGAAIVGAGGYAARRNSAKA